MIRFECDYAEGCHPALLKALTDTNFEQHPGYGEDAHCDRARQLIKEQLDAPHANVHFLVGGTQANATVICAALRPHQGAIAAVTGHINVHESGAIEALGHKVLPLPSTDGRITADQVEAYCAGHWGDVTHEHMVQPGMVYISQPTENGTLYTLEQLTALRQVCDKYDLMLYVDGARCGYGLASPKNDVLLPDLARLCDVFYIGGTKCGAMFGEAVVISTDALKEDFRYLIKRHGGMLAKGWQLGVQFDALFEDDLYYTISAHANRMADRIRDTLEELNIPSLAQCTTNQIFPILPDAFLEELSREFTFTEMHRVDDSHRAIRFCTS